MAIFIDGVKHACVPCIRGHRSTKCQHHDRVLMNVRKPGRPLSTCPHPSGGAGCQCGRSVRAALPRNTKCGCPDEEEHEEHLVLEDTRTSDHVKNEPESAELGPMSPGRVQKAKTAQKVSYDPSQLGRMDMSNINLVQNTSGMPSAAHTQSHMKNHTGTSAYSATTHPAAPASYVPMAHGVGFPMATDMYHGQYSQPGVPQQLGGMIASASGAGEMANGKGHLAGLLPGANGNGTHVGPQHNEIPRAKGSCCSSKAQTPAHSQPLSVGTGSAPSGAANLGAPVAMHQDGSNSFIPTAYDGLGLQPVLPFHQAHDFSRPEPRNLGTISHPLERIEWERAMMAHNENATSQEYIPPSQIHQHVCGCGEGCQCVGCQAHPFNDTTKALIESAYEEMSDRDDGNSRTTSSTPQETGEAHSPNQDAGTALMSSDFLFVNYDVGCDGEESSCRCGPSCACIGCFIHGNAPA